MTDRQRLLAGAAVAGLIAIATALLWPRGDIRPATAVNRAEAPPLETPGLVPLIGAPADGSLIYGILAPLPPLDYGQLIHRIDELPDTLTESESMAVCRALRNGLPEYAPVPSPQRHHVANQLMDALLRQAAAGEWLAGELAAIWKSQKADETVRDYALQHLAQLMEGRGPASPHLAGWRADGFPVLLAAARDSHHRSSGTAILALHFLSASASGLSVPLIPAEEFDSLLDSVAADRSADPSARAAAFQAVAARGRGNLLTTARELSGASGTPSGLRVAAIHYLGVCGQNEDTAILSSVEALNDLRFLTAARTARARILERP